MIRAGNLDRVARLRHAFFTREGGISRGAYASLNCGLGSGDDKANVAENRARAMAGLELAPERLCTAYQVHGTSVEVVNEPWPWDDRPRADAMVTAAPGVALGVLTADCAPVLLAEPEAGVIGAVHAGWRGALAGVVEAALEVMTSLGARRERINAALGPCIAQASYEVGPEFPAPFLADDPESARFFRTGRRPDHFQFDLAGYVLKRLEGAGIAGAEHVDGDTCSDEARFFSYRRACLRKEENYGRGLSAITLDAGTP